MRWVQGIAFAAGAATLVAAAPAPAPKEIWTPAWTASMWQGVGEKQTVAIENATISFQVRVGAPGSKLRLRLSNEYGPALKIGAATVRVPGGQTVKVTFDGQTSTLMPANAPLISDAAPLAVKQFDLVEVSIYLPEKVSLQTVHSAGGAKTSWLNGDQTAKPFESVTRTDLRPLLAGIDVLSDTARPVVVAYGDSITDATGCANEVTPVCRWGDQLGRRFAKAGKPHVVITQAISGNRVISRGSGPSALSRFDRDVLALPGVTHVVVLEGVNDMGGSGRVRGDNTVEPTITAEQLIQGYRQIIKRAHDRGIKVIGLTVLPYEGAGYYKPEGEAIRSKVNEWILKSGEFDGVFDLAKVMADPTNPKALDPKMHRGDFLHPHGDGEFKMGESIDLNLFK